MAKSSDLKKKLQASKSSQFRSKHLGYTQEQLEQMTKKALNQARVRIQRLTKATGGLDSSKLSTAAHFALEPLKVFMNKSGNISLAVKGKSKDTLIHMLEAATNFNKASYTTVKGNREQYAKEAKSSGRTVEEQEQYKRYWKIADDYGLLDWYEPSEEEHSEDVYKFVTDAEEAEMTDEQFIDFVRRKVLERANGIYSKLKEEDERNSGDLYDEQFAKILGKILGNPMS